MRNILSSVIGRRFRKLSGALFLAASAFAHDGYHGGLLFVARMDGAQEVPAVTTSAKGLVAFKLNATMDTIFVQGAIHGLGSAITKLHIHAGARGVAGGVIVDLMPMAHGNSISAAWTTFTTAQLGQMMRGACYVNLHTVDKPAGELRGQLELEQDRVFVARLDGGQEVPAIATSATGVAEIELSPDDSVLSVTASVQGLSDSITAAHFHNGAAGASGAVAANLTSGISGNTVASEIRVSSLANPAAFLDSLKKGSLYMNVHSKAHPTGEIRGQVLPKSGLTLFAELSGDHEVPAVTTPASGLGWFKLSDDDSTLSVDAVFSGLKDSVTLAHFHLGEPGAAGPVVANLVPLLSGNRVSGALMISSLANPAAFVEALYKGRIYMNVHSKASPAGEIRGQALAPARQGYAFRLEGAQETPPVSTQAFAAGIVSLNHDLTDFRYDIVADGLESDFVSSHFHVGAPGVSGGPALNITSAFHDLVASGIWTNRDAAPLTPALAASLTSGLFYVNIHSKNHPTGEIRAQVVDSKATAGSGVRLPETPGALEGRIQVIDGGMAFRVRGAPGQWLHGEVLDMRGQVVSEWLSRQSAQGFGTRIGLSDLAPGMYLALWRDAEGARKAIFSVSR